MRIAILGSWRENDAHWKFRGEKSQFDAACEELGREFGQRKQLVIVGGESENTADSHVVRGYAAVIGKPAQRPLIEVIRPEDDSQAFHGVAMQHQGLLTFPPSAQRRWGDTHLIQIRDADAVLVVGGRGGTYQAGLAAIVAKKRLVPIGSFGGAAARLLKSLHELRPRGDTELNTLNGPWNAHTRDAAIRSLGLDRQTRLLVIHGRSEDYYKLTEWLRNALRVETVVMQQEFGEGQTLPEKFETLAGRVDGAIALATPDDFGGVAGSDERRMRARQNVWLEVGWVWGRLGRDKVMVLSKGSLELPSDMRGIEFYEYDSSPVESAEKIRAFVGQLSGAAQT